MHFPGKAVAWRRCEENIAKLHLKFLNGKSSEPKSPTKFYPRPGSQCWGSGFKIIWLEGRRLCPEPNLLQEVVPCTMDVIKEVPVQGHMTREISTSEMGLWHVLGSPETMIVSPQNSTRLLSFAALLPWSNLFSATIENLMELGWWATRKPSRSRSLRGLVLYRTDWYWLSMGAS